MLIELIPIGTLLAVITTQVIETAVAAQDVLVEKESFRLLAKYIQDIQPLLHDLRNRELRESPAVRTALESLQEDLRKARTLIDNCISKPKMYLLVNCRTIVKDAQQIARDLAKSLQLMALAGAEVAVDISENVNRLKDQMMNAQFHASESKLVVVDKLELGLREHRTDQGFANDLLRDIARALGIQVDTSEMSEELASFKREKEEAALRKEREEEAFMEQIIALLSLADTAESSSITTASDRIEITDLDTLDIFPPLNSFVCPLKQDVMVDPVSLVTGSCFERSYVAKWFEAGNKCDPVTGKELSDTRVRPNVPLRQSIEEWQERNDWIGILKAKSMLQSGNESQQRISLEDIIELCQRSKLTRDWIGKEGLMVYIVNALKCPSRDIKRASLSALHSLITNHAANKNLLADAGGIEQIVRCLAREPNLAKPAAALLLECLNRNDQMSVKIGAVQGALFLLVTLLKTGDQDVAEIAGLTLEKLSDETENVFRMAEADWCMPLITCLCDVRDDSSKVSIVKRLGTLKLSDASKTSLAEEGALAPLLKMIQSGKLEAKMAALCALQNLSTHRPIIEYIAKAGAIPSILNLLLAGMSPVLVREAAAKILYHVAATDGIRHFADGNSATEDQVIENLLAVQDNSSNNLVIQGHILRMMLCFVSPPDADKIRDSMRSMQGVSMLLPLIGRPDHDVRDTVIQILYHLSDKGGAKIAEYFQKQGKFQAIMKFLDSGLPENVQAAAAGLLASFPPDVALTFALIDAEAVPLLVSVLQTGTPKVKEAAMGALIRFTDSSNIEMQRFVANLNIHSLLVRLVHSGTVSSKAKAALALRNFSRNTPLLSIEPDVLFCSCLVSPRFPVCKVHGGKCGVKSTFCIVEADAVPGLVALIKDDRGVAARAGLEALETLVARDDILYGGVQLLHNMNGISPILDTLTLGTPELKEKSVELLERIFMVRGMKETYGNRSRIPLVELASSGSSTVKRKVARVLMQLQLIQDISTYA